MAIEWLLRLAVHLGEERYEALARRALRPMADLMTRYPSGFARYLAGLDLSLGPVAEVALVWPGGQDAGALLPPVFGRYRPNRIVAGCVDGAAPADLPLLAGKRAIDGRPTAYVCRRYACEAPTTEPARLERQLDGDPG
jgi:hypothetical protein